MVSPVPVILTRVASLTSRVKPKPLLIVGTIPSGSGPASTNIVASGRVTLVAGVATVNSAFALTNSVIQVSPNTLGTVTSPKAVGVTARVNGTSFTITSSDLTDTSSVGWTIIA